MVNKFAVPKKRMKKARLAGQKTVKPLQKRNNGVRWVSGQTVSKGKLYAIGPQIEAEPRYGEALPAENSEVYNG